MLNTDSFIRLDKEIRNVLIPIHGISGSEGSIRIDFKDEATTQQKLDAQNIVNNFDWSDAAHSVWLNLQNRSLAKTFLDSTGANEKLIRAVADILKDEINILRGWITDFKTDVAAAVSLADLKVRISANPDLQDRTLVQLKTAINSKIDSGSID